MPSTTNHDSVSLHMGSNHARSIDDISSKKKGKKKQYTFKEKLDMLETGSYPDDLDSINIKNWKRDELTIRAAVALGHGDSFRIVSFIFGHLYIIYLM